MTQAETNPTAETVTETVIVPATPAGIEWYRETLYRTEALLAQVAAENETLKFENATLRQEASELHELLAVAGETVENLERALKRERQIVRLAINAAGLFRISDTSRRCVRINSQERTRCGA
jgi:hypothetical protein